ncbi:hypothetical protein LTR08_003935 [Meristemomyces frigidus]|nr:hypothetical protein LTR08_003935 [Meristemomyces frigidus]
MKEGNNVTAPPASIPKPPPLPTPRPLQRARDAAYKFIGYPSRPSSPHVGVRREALTQGVTGKARYASLTATQNATAIHKTGLEINTIAINERGTHALLGGKEIFKTVKIEDGICAEEVNLRTAIRSTPNAASGKPRQTYSIDIADVAWAKGDCGDYVAAATSSGKIILYDLGHAGFPAVQLHEHFRQVHTVTFNPHRSTLLLSGSQDGTVRLWDLRDVRHEANSLQSKRKFSGQSDGVRDVKWSPTDGVDFAFGTDSGWVQRWDMRNLKAAKVKVPAHTLSCNIIDWHPDGKHIASASSDQFVRVWDFSHNSKQRALWEIKAPHPVMNARWRPSCESSMPHDNGARQCTQLVTAYDREHPVIHVWDLRRPAMPFREMAPYSSAPTDLLWHSQDLLWTVGREGAFLQSDIQHAPKVIDKRNLSSFAISPEGDVKFVTQKRKQRRSPKHHHPSIQTSNNGDSLSVSPDTILLSRSWADDSLDHSFLRVAPAKRQSRSESAAAMDINNGGPSMAVLPLGVIMNNRVSFAPQQSMIIGRLPYHVDPDVFRDLARGYTHSVKLTSSIDDGLLRVIEDAFDSNTQLIASAGLHNRAQSVKIVAFITLNHLKVRAKAQLEKKVETHEHPRHATGQTALSALAVRLLAEHSESPEPWPPSVQPVSTLTKQLAAMDSTSNVPTPLARPVSDANLSAAQNGAQLPDPDNDEQLTLPPSLTAHVQQVLPPEISFFNSQLTANNLKSLTGTDRVDMVRRWSIQPKVPLSLDPVDDKPKLQTHDSNESFSFMVGSADSKDLSSSLGSARHASDPNLLVVPATTVRAGNRSANGNTNEDVAPPAEIVEIRIASRGREHADEPSSSPRASGADESLYSLPDEPAQDLEEGKPFILVELLTELVKDALKAGDAQTATMLVTMIAPLLPRTHPLSHQEVEDTVLTYTDTYALMGFLPEEIAGVFDKHLQHTVMAGLQPLQIESIMSCYHEQLMSFRMFTEAAYLRKLAYPAYPAVYEDYMKDNTIHLKCGRCGKSVQNGMARTTCEGCSEKQASCPVCRLNESPYRGGMLMSSCMLCGHGGHAECLRQWFEDAKGEECPTGCGCLCSG